MIVTLGLIDGMLAGRIWRSQRTGKWLHWFEQSGRLMSVVVD